VGALVSVQKKTLPMDALRVALADCEFCGKPAQAIWRLHVFTCTACGAELEKQAAADAPPEASAAGAAPLPGMELT
jgi:ribosomal protein L37AE/L43A